jgi:hypothetical protein
MDMTKFQRPNLRWHKANDGALVMVWSLSGATRPALGVSGNLSSPRFDAASNNAHRVGRLWAERVAIVSLLGGSALLTFASFIGEHSNLL